MKKGELISAVSTATNQSKAEAESVINAVFDSIGEELSEGGSVRWPGFGTFSVKDRSARQARNPQTGATIQVQACKVVKFKPANALKDTVQ